MEFASALGLALGSSWSSGINLYAATFSLGVLGWCGVKLPGELEVLTNPWIIGLAVILYCVEFVADKIPWFDSIWDGIHTFIRVPAGAALAYLSFGDYPPAAEAAAALLGGSVALSSHGAKAATRVALNASPEPVTNWIASILEDVGAVVMVVMAVVVPIIAALFVIAFVIAVIWMAPRVFRALRRVLRMALGTARGRNEADNSSVPNP